MKRIIYVAAALIICASAFGIADYFSAKKQGKLVNYNDNPQQENNVVLQEQKEQKQPEQVVTAVNKKEPAGIKSREQKVAPDNKLVKQKPDAVKEEKKEVPDVKSAEVRTDVVIDTTLMDTLIKKNERRISADLFSRAPIRQKEPKRKH